MTEELKPHQIAQLVNKLRDIAREFHAHDCLRELISQEVNSTLTQRPAAQTEREAFESAALAKWGQLDFERSEAEPEMYYNQRLDDAWIGFGFAVAWLRASLPAPQQATPEPVLRFCPGCGSVGDVPDTFRDCCPDGAKARMIPASLAHSCHDLFNLAIGAAQQSATPEPVGEPFGYFRALPFGWEQCGEHDDGAVALYDHPAPAVPGANVSVPLQVLKDASIEPRLFIQEHYATVSDGQHAAERHQFIKPLPEPFGYVSDWFGGPGVRFQREPYPELHQLTHSVASVYSVSQLMRSAHDAHTAGREQGLMEAAERARSEGITGISADDDEIVADWLEAAAIEQLKASA